MNGGLEIREALETSKCLMLLQKVGQNDVVKRVFKCKTCSKEFSSFQALGGHRASHKNARASNCGGPRMQVRNSVATTNAALAAPHGCAICGVMFTMGQALGGHMRRHRRENPATNSLLPAPVMMKKSSSGKRILCLDLKLGIMMDDLDLKLGLGRTVC